MELFDGNYDQFQRILKEREIRLEKEAILQDKERKRLQGIIDKYLHGNEKKAKIAKDRQKKSAKLEENAVIVEKKSKTANVVLHQGRESTKHPLMIKDVSFKYDKSAKRNILYKINFDIPRGEKFLIVGENGVGKSTLLKLIVGELTPDLGEIVIGDKTDIGYYAQEHEQIDMDKNLLDNLNDFDLTENEKRGFLGRFLFFGDDLFKKAKVLSPGERARLALLKLTLMKANLLILDEPTNHLDPDTQRVIASNLKTFPGTIILVSHNEEFVDNLGVERTLVLPEGRIDYYDKDVVIKYHMLNEKKKKK
jgi:ATP-binding cassette subfamily F protein 3